VICLMAAAFLSLAGLRKVSRPPVAAAAACNRTGQVEQVMDGTVQCVKDVGWGKEADTAYCRMFQDNL
jgi:hypothetical protein